jgi:hypothetical protein
MNEQKFKHQCAVRQLVKWRRIWGLKAFREYMHKYKDKFGWELVRDFEDQWLKGNRADEKGDWK